MEDMRIKGGNYRLSLIIAVIRGISLLFSFSMIMQI